MARFEVETIDIGVARRSPIVFAFWNVQPAIVLDNVRRYAEAAGERVRCLVVAGDYEAALRQTLPTQDAPHLFYAQRAEASRWAGEGLIAAVDERHAAIEPVLAGMDRRLVEGARYGDGRLLGLTYYNGGPFALFVHPGFRDRVAPDELASLEGILRACRALAADGICLHPFVPRWHGTQTGLVWSLLCHLAAEGVVEFDDPRCEAALTRVLAFMAAAWSEGLVPPQSLDDQGDGPAIERWAGGRHALTFTMDYLARDAAELAGDAVSLVAPAYPARPLMPGHALLCMRERIDAGMRERTLRLMAVLGGPEVHRRWLTERLFAVPVPALDVDLAVAEAIGTAFADGGVGAAALIAARQRACVSPPTHQPRFLDWSEACDDMVRNAMLRQRRLTPADAAAGLLAQWRRMVMRG